MPIVSAFIISSETSHYALIWYNFKSVKIIWVLKIQQCYIAPPSLDTIFQNNIIHSLK